MLAKGDFQGELPPADILPNSRRQSRISITYNRVSIVRDLPPTGERRRRSVRPQIEIDVNATQNYNQGLKLLFSTLDKIRLRRMRKAVEVWNIYINSIGNRAKAEALLYNIIHRNEEKQLMRGWSKWKYQIKLQGIIKLNMRILFQFLKLKRRYMLNYGMSMIYKNIIKNYNNKLKHAYFGIWKQYISNHKKNKKLVRKYKYQLFLEKINRILEINKQRRIFEKYNKWKNAINIMKQNILMNKLKEKSLNCIGVIYKYKMYHKVLDILKKNAQSKRKSLLDIKTNHIIGFYKLYYILLNYYKRRLLQSKSTWMDYIHELENEEEKKRSYLNILNKICNKHKQNIIHYYYRVWNDKSNIMSKLINKSEIDKHQKKLGLINLDNKLRFKILSNNFTNLYKNTIYKEKYNIGCNRLYNIIKNKLHSKLIKSFYLWKNIMNIESIEEMNITHGFDIMAKMYNSNSKRRLYRCFNQLNDNRNYLRVQSQLRNQNIYKGLLLLDNYTKNHNNEILRSKWNKWKDKILIYHSLIRLETLINSKLLYIKCKSFNILKYNTLIINKENSEDDNSKYTSITILYSLLNHHNKLIKSKSFHHWNNTINMNDLIMKNVLEKLEIMINNKIRRIKIRYFNKLHSYIKSIELQSTSDKRISATNKLNNILTKMKINRIERCYNTWKDYIKPLRLKDQIETLNKILEKYLKRKAIRKWSSLFKNEDRLKILLATIILKRDNRLFKEVLNRWKLYNNDKEKENDNKYNKIKRLNQICNNNNNKLLLHSFHRLQYNVLFSKYIENLLFNILHRKYVKNITIAFSRLKKNHINKKETEESKSMKKLFKCKSIYNIQSKLNNNKLYTAFYKWKLYLINKEYEEVKKKDDMIIEKTLIKQNNKKITNEIFSKWKEYVEKNKNKNMKLNKLNEIINKHILQSYYYNKWKNQIQKNNMMKVKLERMIKLLEKYHLYNNINKWKFLSNIYKKLQVLNSIKSNQNKQILYKSYMKLKMNCELKTIENQNNNNQQYNILKHLNIIRSNYMKSKLLEYYNRWKYNINKEKEMSSNNIENGLNKLFTIYSHQNKNKLYNSFNRWRLLLLKRDNINCSLKSLELILNNKYRMKLHKYYTYWKNRTMYLLSVIKHLNKINDIIRINEIRNSFNRMKYLSTVYNTIHKLFYLIRQSNERYLFNKWKKYNHIISQNKTDLNYNEKISKIQKKDAIRKLNIITNKLRSYQLAKAFYTLLLKGKSLSLNNMKINLASNILERLLIMKNKNKVQFAFIKLLHNCNKRKYENNEKYVRLLLLEEIAKKYRKNKLQQSFNKWYNNKIQNENKENLLKKCKESLYKYFVSYLNIIMNNYLKYKLQNAFNRLKQVKIDSVEKEKNLEKIIKKIETNKITTSFNKWKNIIKERNEMIQSLKTIEIIHNNMINKELYKSYIKWKYLTKESQNQTKMIEKMNKIIDTRLEKEYLNNWKEIHHQHNNISTRSSSLLKLNCMLDENMLRKKLKAIQKWKQYIKYCHYYETLIYVKVEQIKHIKSVQRSNMMLIYQLLNYICNVKLHMAMNKWKSYLLSKVRDDRLRIAGCDRLEITCRLKNNNILHKAMMKLKETKMKNDIHNQKLDKLLLLLNNAVEKNEYYIQSRRFNKWKLYLKYLKTYEYIYNKMHQKYDSIMSECLIKWREYIYNEKNIESQRSIELSILNTIYTNNTMKNAINQWKNYVYNKNRYITAINILYKYVNKYIEKKVIKLLNDNMMYKNRYINGLNLLNMLLLQYNKHLLYNGINKMKKEVELTNNYNKQQSNNRKLIHLNNVINNYNRQYLNKSFDKWIDHTDLAMSSYSKLLKMTRAIRLYILRSKYDILRNNVIDYYKKKNSIINSQLTVSSSIILSHVIKKAVLRSEKSYFQKWRDYNLYMDMRLRSLQKIVNKYKLSNKSLITTSYQKWKSYVMWNLSTSLEIIYNQTSSFSIDVNEPNTSLSLNQLHSQVIDGTTKTEELFNQVQLLKRIVGESIIPSDYNTPEESEYDVSDSDSDSTYDIENTK